MVIWGSFQLVLILARACLAYTAISALESCKLSGLPITWDHLLYSSQAFRPTSLSGPWDERTRGDPVVRSLTRSYFGSAATNQWMKQIHASHVLVIYMHNFKTWHLLILLSCLVVTLYIWQWFSTNKCRRNWLSWHPIEQCNSTELLNRSGSFTFFIFFTERPTYVINWEPNVWLLVTAVSWWNMLYDYDLKRVYAVVQKGCSITLYPSSQLQNIPMPTIRGSPFMQSAKVVPAFYPRDAMLARVIAIATCLSVWPSVTRRYCVKTKKEKS